MNVSKNKNVAIAKIVFRYAPRGLAIREEPAAPQLVLRDPPHDLVGKSCQQIVTLVRFLAPDVGA
jgi:hypothetical protein